MGAFAAVRVPLDLSRRTAAAIVAHDVVDTFPGTRNVAVDDVAGTVSFEMQFPGNLSALVARLREQLIPAGAAATVSIPVANRAPAILGARPERLHEELESGGGPEIWDPEFARGPFVHQARIAGGMVEASVVPCSDAMHELYDTLLTLGFVADDAAAAAP